MRAETTASLENRLSATDCTVVSVSVCASGVLVEATPGNSASPDCPVVLGSACFCVSGILVGTIPGRNSVPATDCPVVSVSVSVCARWILVGATQTGATASPKSRDDGSSELYASSSLKCTVRSLSSTALAADMAVSAIYEAGLYPYCVFTPLCLCLFTLVC